MFQFNIVRNQKGLFVLVSGAFDDLVDGVHANGFARIVVHNVFDILPRGSDVDTPVMEFTDVFTAFPNLRKYSALVS